jgi:hypothetical protein
VVSHIQFSGRLTADTLEVWLFPVEVFEDGNKHTFEARSDMEWKEFKDRVVARLNAIDIRLNYRLNAADSRAWSDLSCEADLTVAMTHLGAKALVARSRKVTMEVKNVVSNRLSMTDKGLLCLLCCRHQSRVHKGRGNDHGLMTCPLQPHRIW